MKTLWICLTVLAVALLLPFFYVLSTGPAFWLATRGWISIELYVAYFFPLQYVIGKDGVLHDLIASYNRAWLPVDR